MDLTNGSQETVLPSKTSGKIDYQKSVFFFYFLVNDLYLLKNGRRFVSGILRRLREHAHGSLGITQGHFDCLFSFIVVRTAKFECSSVFVWTGIFSKTLLVWTRIYFCTDKKDAFSIISGYAWVRPYTKTNLSGDHLRCLQNVSNQTALKRAKFVSFKPSQGQLYVEK